MSTKVPTISLNKLNTRVGNGRPGTENGQLAYPRLRCGIKMIAVNNPYQYRTYKRTNQLRQ